MRVLFVTWDGPDLSYAESLFLPIFAGLKPFGVHVDMLQFRWGERHLDQPLREACAQAGIGYEARYISRRLGSAGPLLSALWGRRALRSSVRRFGSDILMPRGGMMPALVTLAAGGAKVRPILFDADGFPVDERVEYAGLSPSGLTYRLFRDLEAELVRQARSVIVRSDAAIPILRARAGPNISEGKFHVVTNGRDEHLFDPGDQASRAEARRELGISGDAPLLVYAGSVGKQYRFDRLGALARAVRGLRPDARLLLLSGSPDEARRELAETHPDEAAAAIATRAAPGAIARLLAAGDIGVSFRQAGFSTQGVAPIKLSEYLLCGLPVVGTAAVGRTQPAIESGLFFDDAGDFPDGAARWVVGTVLPNRDSFRHKARQTGIACFSLQRSVSDYLAAMAPLRDALTPGSGMTREDS